MNRSLRIAMVSEYAYPVLGGITEHVHYLSSELAALGHDVTVVTGNARRADRARAAAIDAAHRDGHGYRTVRIGHSLPVPSNGSIARMTFSPTVLGQLARATRHADVVHAQGLVGPVLPLFTLRASLGVPALVGTFHTYVAGDGHWAYRLFNRRLNAVFDELDRRIAVSQVCVDSLEPFFGGTWDVVPNGIDTQVFRPLACEADRAPGPPRILFVGRFDSRNGLHTLLDAAKILADAGRDFEVQVVGDGPARHRYETQARRLGIWDRVRWLGLLNEERPELYRQATVFAAPCTLASFGVVLLEAMASGTPIVCADNVGFRQVIRDGAPGRFVPGSDPAALAAGIAEVLDDAGLRADWAVRGRRVTEERYAWPSVARTVESLYREVLDDGRTPRSTSHPVAEEIA